MGSACCTCCCCCCCCAHVIGGLGGALGTSVVVAARGGISERIAVLAYWSVVVSLSLGFTLLGVQQGEIFIGLIAVILGIPVVQFVASVVSLLCVLVLPVPSRAAASKAILHVSLWALVGGLAGVALMFVIGMLAVAL